MTTQTLNFSSALPGLPGLTQFSLELFDPSGALLTLTSTQDGGPQFFVATPQVFFENYVLNFPDEVTQQLGTADPQVLVILTLGADLTEHTANLSAPILVNPETGAAIQLVLDQEQYSVRTPLLVA